MTPRQELLASLAPLVKSGLVDRDEALRQDAEWQRVGYDKAGMVKNGAYVGEIVEVKTSIPRLPKPEKEKRAKEVFTEQAPELFTVSVKIETRKRWIPAEGDIF
jgi:hypothetical protein